MLHKYKKHILYGFISFLVIWGIYKFIRRDQGLHIALVGPMTGKGSANGKSYLHGVKLYIDALNEKGGLDGREVIIDVYDDENTDEKAEEKAREIVKKNQALAVIGHNKSSCSIKGGAIYKENGIPAITPSSTNVKVTQGNEWYFRAIFNDESQGKFLANYVGRVLKQNSFAVLEEDGVYGSYLSDIFQKTLAKQSYFPSAKWKIQAGKGEITEKEIESVINQIKTSNFKGLIFLATSPPEGAQFIKLFKEASLSNQLLAPDAFASNTFLEAFSKIKKENQIPGYYSNDLMVTTPLIFDNANEKAQEFKNKYKILYNADPDWRAAYAYDSIAVILEAIHKSNIENSKSTRAEDRKKIRDYLASMQTIDEAVEGVTGFNYFDEFGNSPKPISIGSYKNNNIISSLTQLQSVKNLKEITNLEKAEKEEKVLKIENNYLYKTNVIYTGIEINEITNLDISKLTYTLDFYIWFRYKGNIKPEEIEFLNTIEPVKLGEVIEEDSNESISYKVYHVKGNFKADSLPIKYELGYNALGVNFKHKTLTRNNLIYVIDVLGMGLLEKKSKVKKNLQAILSPVSGYSVSNFWFFQDTLSRASLGSPKYINSKDAKAEYSRFNLGVRVKKNDFTFRGLFPSSHAMFYLILSILILVGLVVVKRLKMFQKYNNLNWVASTLFLFILLISVEIETVDTLLDDSNTYTIKMVTLFFDILWWIFPAMRLIQAIERFVWDPLEIKTGNKIPTVVRLFLATFVYILTFFAIVAFVFDQKITSLLATSGVVAMIIGLAIQVNISNVFSGIAINLERPFRVGDWVKIGTLDEGKVVDITWRTTRIRTRNAIIVSIPNSKASESSIQNFGSKEDITEFWFTIKVDPAVDTRKVQKVLLDALLSAEGVLKNPAPYTRLNEFSDWAADYIIGYCWKDYGKKNAVRKAVFTSIWTHLHRAGIKPAMQRHEIHLYKGKGNITQNAEKPENVIKEIDIFKTFDDEEKEYLISNSKTISYKPGDVVVKTGDTDRSMFVISEGVVSVQTMLENGKMLEVASLGAGNFFGEMAMLTGAKRTVDIVALTDTKLIQITNDNFEPLLKNHPEIMKQVNSVSNTRKKDTDTQKILNELPPEAPKDNWRQIIWKKIKKFWVILTRKQEK
jgi:branched-chain amino acid transport system substrate-binding protein